MFHSKPEREYVEKLPKSASFIENENPYANNFITFENPEVLVYFTVTGNDANEPNKIIKETFYQKHE